MQCTWVFAMFVFPNIFPVDIAAQVLSASVAMLIALKAHGESHEKAETLIFLNDRNLVLQAQLLAQHATVAHCILPWHC